MFSTIHTHHATIHAQPHTGHVSVYVVSHGNKRGECISIIALSLYVVTYKQHFIH